MDVKHDIYISRNIKLAPLKTLSGNGGCKKVVLMNMNRLSAENKAHREASKRIKKENIKAGFLSDLEATPFYCRGFRAGKDYLHH